MTDTSTYSIGRIMSIMASRYFGDALIYVVTGLATAGPLFYNAVMKPDRAGHFSTTRSATGEQKGAYDAKQQSSAQSGNRR